MSRSLSWGSALVAALLVGCATSGCGRSEEVPPLAASSDAPAVGAEVGDLVRDELRRLYASCERKREALTQELDHQERRYARITAAAAVAWIVGEAFRRQPPPGPELTQPECTSPGGAGVGTSRCNPQTIRVAGSGLDYDPSRESVRSVALNAREQLTAINRAIDQTDTLIFSRPDLSTWSPAEWARWNQLREVLRVLCE